VAAATETPTSKTGTVQRGFFTIGSTKDEVLAAQGTPSAIIGDQWFYGSSWVTFSKGTVSGWNTGGNPLKVR